MKHLFINSMIIFTLLLCNFNLFSQQTGSFTMTFNNGGTTSRMDLYVPEDYDSTKTYPFIYGWHGSGMPASDMRSILRNTIGIKVKAIICCPDINDIVDDNTKVNNLVNTSINYMFTTYKIDPTKTIVSGFSMGGGIAFQLGLYSPEVFKGIIGLSPAIASATMTDVMWSNIGKIRMASILGDLDFNFAAVNSLMTEIKSKGASLYYLVKPGVEHADNTYYSSQEFIDDYQNCYNYVLNISKNEANITLTGNLNFGNIEIGKNSSIDLSITNDGNTDLKIDSISFPAGFTGNWSGSIASKQTKSIPVNFTPSEEKTYSGQIKVYSNAISGTNTIPISGTGIKKTGKIFLSGNLNFGNVELGKNGNENLSIVNQGNGDLKVDSISCPEGFTCNWSGIIASNQTKIVSINFIPTEEKSYTGKITIYSNASSGINTIDISGTGIKATSVSYSDNNNSNTLLFPNPVYGNNPITINLDVNSQVTANIYNIQGELVKAINFNSLENSNNKLIIPTDSLNSGIYTIVLQYQGNTKSTMLSIVR